MRTSSWLRRQLPLGAGTESQVVQLDVTLLVRPDGDEFLFAHALIRDGVYASLTKVRRSELHRAAAAWFEMRNGTTHRKPYGVVPVRRNDVNAKNPMRSNGKTSDCSVRRSRVNPRHSFTTIAPPR